MTSPLQFMTNDQLAGAGGGGASYEVRGNNIVTSRNVDGNSVDFYVILRGDSTDGYSIRFELGYYYLSEGMYGDEMSNPLDADDNVIEASAKWKNGTESVASVEKRVGKVNNDYTTQVRRMFIDIPISDLEGLDGSSNDAEFQDAFSEQYWPLAITIDVYDSTRTTKIDSRTLNARFDVNLSADGS